MAAPVHKPIPEKYLKLPFPKNKCQIEYIWIDNFKKLRSKSRTLDIVPSSLNGNYISVFMKKN